MNYFIYHIVIIESMVNFYSHMDLIRKQTVQKKFVEYMKSNLSEDPKISEWINWENKKDTMEWLDSL